ncbi:carboxyl-terminal hydrolase [Anaeramoeba flamelloides]|uniref:ubiquitinyl hydrolase 1 n=1 Tax=Anaeramoeba flamelloides TaxID=1746091 RepID=A0AAV7ZSY5_9EUKA|nr:carboxyl-terminal hydrolase [Anaeramoeba flamelloides]
MKKKINVKKKKKKKMKKKKKKNEEKEKEKNEEKEKEKEKKDEKKKSQLKTKKKKNNKKNNQKNNIKEETKNKKEDKANKKETKIKKKKKKFFWGLKKNNNINKNTETNKEKDVGGHEQDNEKSTRWKNLDSYGYTLFASLHDYIRKEKLDRANKYCCKTCTKMKYGSQKNIKKNKRKHVKVIATKQIIFKELPTLLVVNYKRFVQTSWGRLKKNNEEASFPFSFSFNQFLDENHIFEKDQYDNDPKVEIIYDLFSITVHSGGLCGGHYVAYSKKSDDQWYHCSDLSIKPATIEDVKKCKAYILFYCRRN